jgi:hypothetical protein
VRDNCQAGFPCEEEEGSFVITSFRIPDENGQLQRDVTVRFKALDNAVKS